MTQLKETRGKKCLTSLHSRNQEFQTSTLSEFVPGGRRATMTRLPFLLITRVPDFAPRRRTCADGSGVARPFVSRFRLLSVALGSSLFRSVVVTGGYKASALVNGDGGGERWRRYDAYFSVAIRGTRRARRAAT